MKWYWKITSGGNSYCYANKDVWKPFSKSLSLGSGLAMTIQKARKQYRCEKCRHLIEIGDTYARFRYMRESDGIPAYATSIVHTHCFTSGVEIETQYLW